MSAGPRETLTISEQAARWLCELDGGDPRVQTQLLAWLKQSPRHVEEFLFATATWKSLRQGAGNPSMDVTAILAEVSAGGGASTIVSLRNSPTGAAAATASRRGRKRVFAAAASVVAATGALAWWLAAGATYSTTVGEQRTVQLEDGSVLYLNTDSRVRVKFSRSERAIRLLQGEALFVVAQQPGRPFRVSTATTKVEAVGTQFNVRQKTGSAVVSVLEGRVRVEDALHPQLVDAGEEARVAQDKGRIVKHIPADIRRSVAWRERRLVFRTAPLAEVVAEINRYSNRRFSIEGRGVGDTLLTATFDADDPDSLAVFLQRYSHLRVERRGEHFLIRGQRTAYN